MKIFVGYCGFKGVYLWFSSRYRCSFYDFEICNGFGACSHGNICLFA